MVEVAEVVGEKDSVRKLGFFPKNREKREKAFDLFRQGWNMAKIAAEIGVHNDTVRNWLVRAGLLTELPIVKRGRGRPPKVVLAPAKKSPSKPAKVSSVLNPSMRLMSDGIVYVLSPTKRGKVYCDMNDMGKLGIFMRAFMTGEVI